MIDKGFIDYCSEERATFAGKLAIDWFSFTVKERVAVESLLVAYDQMLEKLKEIK